MRYKMAAISKIPCKQKYTTIETIKEKLSSALAENASFKKFRCFRKYRSLRLEGIKFLLDV